ncbi:ABC transporter permease [Agrococcus sp. SGAir0287]|uniref:ABC transporter permease n=1 Tax=Agrococcus sp. SGAir0287 TaxID=2070347 RepID=UPI0010CD07DB|nr:ABC transporter permease [Agrococcus sp. SGAir0287]QCR19844.1 ABC transporter permease [Agrococcus sp. SGAir0287]
MSARAMGAVVVAEARMTMRDVSGLVVPLALPMLLLVVSAVQPTTSQVASASGYTILEAYTVPSTIAMVAAMIAIVNMPSFLATYRRTGVLRTLATTPIRPVQVLAAQVVVSAAQLLLGVGLMLAVAVVAFGARLPDRPWAALGVGALGVVAMYAVGMLVAALAPSPNAAVALGLVAFLGLGALGGMLGPNDAYPEGLRLVGDALPFGAMLQGLQATWVGQTVEPGTLVALAIAALVGALAAAAAVRVR